MRLKICTIVILLMNGIGQLHATDYYLSTNGTGTGIGGWGNAAAGSSFFASIAGTTLAPGTHIYIKAGSYSYTVTAPIYLSNNDVLIQGGFPTTATGTDLSGYNPVTNAVIFTLSSTGTAERFFFRSDGTGIASNIIEVKGFQVGQSVGPPFLTTIFSGGSNDAGSYKFSDLGISKNSGSQGLFVLNGFSLGGSTTFTNCFFYNNSSTGYAGVINGDATMPFSIIHCSFSGNASNTSNTTLGGSAVSTSYPGIISVTNSIFCMNQMYGSNAPNGGGGALAAIGNNSTTFNVANCVFANNTSYSGGGPAISCNNGILHIESSQFLNNNCRGSVVGGGAIFMSHSKGGNTVNNCTFTSNI